MGRNAASELGEAVLQEVEGRADPQSQGLAPPLSHSEINRAISALYRENITRLRAYLKRMLKSEADADDIAQETFLRLYRCENFLQFRHLRAVLFKTGYRLALNRLRQRKCTALDRAEVFLDAEEFGVTGSAEDALVAREKEHAFGRALDGLPRRCRQVIELRTVQELSYREMSDTLGLSVSTLEKHLAKGKRVCAELLADDGGWGEQTAGRRALAGVDAVAA